MNRPIAIRVILAAALAVLMSTATIGAEATRLRFIVGTAPNNDGATRVLAGTVYQADAGFGFEAGGKIVATDHCVTSDQPFLFSAKVPEGNYRVRVTLGGEATNSLVTVKAEARRLMLESIPIAVGAVVTQEFTVNLRTPRIGSNSIVRLKQREKDSEQVTWDDKLTLEFNGTRPALRSIEVTREPEAPTVFITGDSTVCDQPNEPWNSWGQMLPRFFKPGVAVANYAQSGESIKSSLSARRFDKIFSEMKSGDWLLVQFGHNDMKDHAPDALAKYRSNLKSIVARTRAKGGTPVLITSMERKAGVNAPTLVGYPEAVRAVAREEQAALIDQNAASLILYRALGDNLDRAFQDGTHHNNYGSYLLAKCVAAGIVKADPRLGGFMVADVRTFDPAHPDRFETFSVPPSPTHSALKPDGN